MTTHDPRWSPRPLMALFAALLAGCTGREVPGQSVEETEGSTSATGTTGSTGEPGEPTGTTTETSDPTSTGSTTTSTSTPATTTGPTTGPPDDPPECVYADHLIVLTPQEYDAWLHGDTTTGDTSDASTGTTDASTTDASTTDASTTDASTGTTDGTTGEDGWTMELCVEICMALTGTDTWSVDSCQKLGVNAEGNIEIKCVEIVEHCDGRSHICIGSRGVTAGADPVAAYFARAAHDEAASVYAFAALEQELAALGAPDELLARVCDAAADEVRHAQAIARLAADRGGRCKPPERRAFAVRGALEIAVENAVEGCVRETWAALLAAHQAEHAQDPEIRAVMRTIAADEARHAELAWAIDRWLQGTLDLGGQARVASARAAAAASIVAGVAASEPAAACVAVAGVPDRQDATRLCRGLAAALWAA